MKNWEDIIKEKLEGYEGPLPEGSLDEFRARREAAGSAAAGKRSLKVWILPTAVAAGLAAFLLLRQPGTPDGSDNWQPSTTIAVANTDTTDAAEAAPQLIAQAVIPQAVQPASAGTKEGAPAAETEKADPADQTEPASPAETANQPQATEPAGTQDASAITAQPQEDNQPEQAGNQNIRTAITFDFPAVEQQKVGKDASYNYAVLATAGGAVGAGLLATLATNINFGWLAENTEPDGLHDMRSAHGDYLKLLDYLDILGIDYTPEFEAALIALLRNAMSSPASDNIAAFFEERGVDTSDPEFADYINQLTSYYMSIGNQTDNTKKENSPVDNRQKTTHYIPVKTALSVRAPVAEKLYLTTGLEYSRYVSTYSYSVSGNHKQVANYLGIPLRLDWTFVSSRWLDLYLGGGMEAEWCLGAKLDGKSIGKDKFGMSLLGAGGLQLNVTKNIGIYVEPEVSWKMSLNKPVLTTYRSEHPLVFAVATGIRLTI